MKKLLLASVAVGALAVATPASAGDHGIKIDVGGVFKGYTVYNDQDEEGDTVEAREFDILRETELHFRGEKTLDSGLTVGLHFETDLDQSGDDNFNTEEAYAYFSGGWGRVNFGKEDGAAYLLQVAAPSADSNIDGVRQFIQPVNTTALSGGDISSLRLDYDQNISGFDNKITYITPVFQGFQAGISYTPEADDNGEATRGTNGVNIAGDGAAGDLGDVIDVAVRYEGNYDKLGVTLGAGYTLADLANAELVGGSTATDDREAFNVAADFDWGPFGFGVSYSEDNNADLLAAAAGEEIDDEEVLVVGVDYTHGPYKLGASYYDSDNTFGIEDLEATRYTGGIVYTYGPGMTFRGSISYVEYEESDATSLFTDTDDADATSVLIGTQIKF